MKRQRITRKNRASHINPHLTEVAAMYAQQPLVARLGFAGPVHCVDDGPPVGVLRNEKDSEADKNGRANFAALIDRWRGAKP